MANTYETELEDELEQELHEIHEGETAGEGEGILNTLGSALGGLFGEGEEEGEMHELHELHEYEEEDEAHELHELHEYEDEFEHGEQFFGKAFKSIGNFVKKAAPVLKGIAKVAAPMVGTAIGGPFGAILGKLASSALGEEEYEDEFAHEMHELHEYEDEYESHETHESAQEALHEIANHEVTSHEALAEMMAEAASHEQHEGEAEAMAGAAAMTVISPADRRALRRILPHLVRGVAILTRILRRRRITRPAVRAVPTIVRRTVKGLKRRAAAGKPISRKIAGRIAAKEVRRVLGNPAVCTAAITRNVKASRTMRRRRPSTRRIAG
jgi:hypothetical protein